MKKVLILFIFGFISLQMAVSAELQPELKKLLTDKFPGINFKIDHSFTVNNEIFLPLIREEPKKLKKIEIIYSQKDKPLSKLLILSNGWSFVKLIKNNDGTQTILSLSEIPEQYRNYILNSKFPSDLVVPDGLTVQKEFAEITGDLPIAVSGPVQNKTENKLTEQKTPLEKPEQNSSLKDIKGVLYLTSPDTGKIVYLNLADLSMVYHIQTPGSPWNISFNKTSNLLYVSDFSKDQIYELKPMEKSIIKTLMLDAMSSPIDIKVPGDGSLIYILESLANDFAIYQVKEKKYFIRTKLPPNPTSFLILKNEIAVACPNTNTITFLSTESFAPVNQVMIDGSPEKILASPDNNTIYIANRNGNSIAVFDIEGNMVKNTISVGETPVSLEINIDGTRLYVGNGKSNSISIIDLKTRQVTDTIDLPPESQFPGDMKLTSDGKTLIITSETTNTISFIDLNSKRVALKLNVGATSHAAYILEK